MTADDDPAAGNRFGNRLANQRPQLFLRWLVGRGHRSEAAPATVTRLSQRVQHAPDERPSSLSISNHRRIEATPGSGARNDLSINVDKTKAVRDQPADLFATCSIRTRYADHTTHHDRRYDHRRNTSSKPS
jgi:hypothetical protein